MLVGSRPRVIASGRRASGVAVVDLVARKIAPRRRRRVRMRLALGARQRADRAFEVDAGLRWMNSKLKRSRCRVYVADSRLERTPRACRRRGNDRRCRYQWPASRGDDRNPHTGLA